VTNILPDFQKFLTERKLVPQRIVPFNALLFLFRGGS